MQELRRLGAPLLNHIANRLAQITERLKPPTWLPVTDAQRQQVLKAQLVRAWEAYQTSDAQQIMEWARVSFYEINKSDASFPQPALAVLGMKPLNVYETFYHGGLYFPPVPATVIDHPSADQTTKTYIIYDQGKPPTRMNHNLVTDITFKHGVPGAKLNLQSTLQISDSQGYEPVPTYCPMETYHQLQTIPKGTLIVPDNSMLIIGSQPSFDDKIIKMEISRREAIVRRPIDFLWVESFKSFPSLPVNR